MTQVISHCSAPLLKAESFIGPTFLKSKVICTGSGVYATALKVKDIEFNTSQFPNACVNSVVSCYLCIYVSGQRSPS